MSHRKWLSVNRLRRAAPSSGAGRWAVHADRSLLPFPVGAIVELTFFVVRPILQVTLLLSKAQVPLGARRKA